VLNCHFENLDHVFANWDQKLFGFQPALLWNKAYPGHIVSELMAMGYSLYFLMFVSLTFYVFFKRYEDFQKVSFILITSFFVYYVVFVLFPVAGPQYYYLAVGVDEIARGNFPEVGTYFANHTEALPVPGWEDGFFRGLVQTAHATGERPTAAFPSSHVGVSTLVMIIALWLKEWKFALIWAIPWIFLCMSTVYLLPHYAVDAIAGFFSAIAVFFLLKFVWDKWCDKL
jgi:membrane-associated phospholipid phosphatase